MDKFHCIYQKLNTNFRFKSAKKAAKKVPRLGERANKEKTFFYTFETEKKV